MFVDEIISPCVFGSRELLLLKQQCSDFLHEADGLPLYKPLPIDYKDFYKVKVRQRKSDTVINTALNQAYEHEFTKLASRAIFAYGAMIESELVQETFYVFPINKYKYIYSPQIQNSAQDYKLAIETLVNTFDDGKAIDFIKESIKYTYTNTALKEGLESQCEIIIYNVPYFYAVRKRAVPQYEKLLDMIGDIK